MNAKEKIFARIREALSIEAHRSGYHTDAGELPGGLPSLADRRQVLPLVPSTEEGLIQLFARNSAELKTTFKVLPNDEAVESELRSLSASENWKKIAAHKTAGLQQLATALGLPVLFTDGGYDKSELEKCDAGITECDALVAQTGSVLVTSRTTGGRALSVLPPHHVVVAKRAQMVPDLPAAFELLQKRFGGNYPSMISFITGPSRTGDIERILVLGAHGPKKLTILLT